MLKQVQHDVNGSVIARSVSDTAIQSARWMASLALAMTSNCHPAFIAGSPGEHAPDPGIRRGDLLLATSFRDTSAGTESPSVTREILRRLRLAG
jgi:hypothetical protein